MAISLSEPCAVFAVRYFHLAGEHVPPCLASAIMRRTSQPQTCFPFVPSIGVDVIAAEDTRNTGHLMKLLLGPKDFSQRFVSHHDHNWETRIPEILRLLRLGKSVAVSDSHHAPCVPTHTHLFAFCLLAFGGSICVCGTENSVTVVSWPHSLSIERRLRMICPG